MPKPYCMWRTRSRTPPCMRPTCSNTTIWADDLPVCLPGRGAYAAEGATISLNPFQLATLRIARG